MEKCPKCNLATLDPDGRCPRCQYSIQTEVPTQAMGPRGRGHFQSGQVAADLEPKVDPLINQLVAGRYLVQSKIGSGGMGKVYLARQVDLDRPVALKVLHPYMVNPERKERFHREARAASRIQHVNAVTVHDYGVWEGFFFMVMEYLQGVSLHSILKTQPAMHYLWIIDIMSQVCDALSAAHDLRIIHRDLKPENIMIQTTADGQELVKVVDFGLAMMVGPAAEERLTQDGAVLGTPSYMSPEQCRGLEVDPRSDIYSLGIILYELLCGSTPFGIGGLTDLVIKHLFSEAAAPSEVNPGANIPADLESLAMRSISKQPEARPQSAAAFKQQLLAVKEWAESGGVSPAPPERKSPIPVTGRDQRADELGIPAIERLSSSETDGGPSVLVIQRGKSFAASLQALIQANGMSAATIESLEQAAERIQQDDPQVVVVDLCTGTDPTMETLTSLLDGGRLAGRPVIVVGPADSFTLMSRVLELGISAYIPASKVTSKLPRSLRRIWRRSR